MPPFSGTKPYSKRPYKLYVRSWQGHRICKAGLVWGRPAGRALKALRSGFLASGTAVILSGVSWAQQPADQGDLESAAAGQVEEIVVTARHRSESAQHVPIALTAIGGQQLEDTHTSDILHLQSQVPSLQVLDFNPRNTNLTIRGLGNNVAIASDGLESGVGVYIDGVYYARPAQAMFDFYDVNRVEVLRGPQGTLFGKNTTAGALNITTNQPSLTPEASAEVSVGDYGFYQLRGMVSGPLVEDKLAGRFSAYGNGRDGFVQDVRTGKDLQDYGNDGARAQLLFQPDDDLTVRAIVDYSYQEENCCINILTGVAGTLANGQPFPNSFYQRAARIGYVPLAINPAARLSDADAPVHLKMEQGGGSVQADWTQDGYTLTSISSYRYWNWYPHNDIDYTAADVLPVANTTSRQRQATQEFRVTSPADGDVTYVGGLFYFHEDLQSGSVLSYGKDAAGWILPASVPLTVGNAALSGFTNVGHDNPTTNSYAAYGQATWHIDDRWSVTGGLRYTYETKDGSFIQYQRGGVPVASLPAALQGAVQAIRNSFAPPASYTASIEQGKISGTANIAYQIDDGILGYVSYARGVKSGGLNLTNVPPGVSPVVGPETIDDYELGLKTEWFDRKLVVNAALYWSDDSDYQAVLSDPVLVTSYLANVGKVRSRGIEIDAQAVPFDGLTVSLSGAYDYANYVSYPSGQCPLEQFTQPVCNLSGRPLPGASRWSGYLNVEYQHPIGQFSSYSVNGYIGADYSYRTAFYTNAADSIYSRVPGYGLLNLRVGARDEDDKWDLSFWVKNAADAYYYLTIGGVSFNSGAIAGIAGDPRTVGGTLRLKF